MLFLKKIDNILVRFFGLKDYSPKHAIKNKNDRLRVIFAEKGCRFPVYKPLEQSVNRDACISDVDKARLGMAAGSVIAKGLTITFMENDEANHG